jgi:hypothetical protein
MIPKPFLEIAKSDIEALVINQVAEGRTLEYKEQLPGGSDEAKREFLADVSSFANAGGGDLIFGVRETRDLAGQATGIPEIAEGLKGINADAEKRRLDEIIRSGIEPRIPGISLKHIDGFPGGPILLIRISQSWLSPHMVVLKNLSRFFSRTSSGKHQLDVSEVREAFAASENLGQRVRSFRSDRISDILTDETTLPLEPGPKVALHLIPAASFGSFAVDLRKVQAFPNRQFYLMGGQGRGRKPRFNFDGYMMYDEFGTPPLTYSYVQIFRNGIIEAVWTNFSREKALLIGPLERELIKALDSHLKLSALMDTAPPLFVTLSLIGVKDLAILTNDAIQSAMFSRPIDRHVLLGTELVVDEMGESASAILRPAFDAVWQSSGWAQSLGYDESGKRIGSLNYD